MNPAVYEYDAVIRSSEIGKGGAYVPFPYDVRQEFGKRPRQSPCHVRRIPYDGSIVNMGVKNEDGSVCYIVGILKGIRSELGKGIGDTVHVTVQERE